MKVVAITGGRRGIGRAIAERLTADGYRVAIGDIDINAATDAVAQLDGAIGLRLDVADPRSFTRFLDKAEHTLGPIDVLVNNAGIMPIGHFLDQDPALARRAVDVNLHGPLNGMRAVLPRMVARGGGHIVNIASTAGTWGVPGGVVYCATKHAVVGMSEAIRQEFAPDGIAVTTVLPSFTNTDLISGTTGLRGVPTVKPSDVAAAVAHALVHRSRTVYVPRFLKGLAAATACLPPRATDALARLYGTDRVFLDFDQDRRAAYQQRIAGTKRK